MKKAVLILMCLAMMLLISACHIHIDTDPWPASPQTAENDPAASQEPPVTATPNPLPEATALPQTTDTPLSDSLVPTVTPTPEPNNETVEPGFNG